jgi:hypothetical protein
MGSLKRFVNYPVFAIITTLLTVCTAVLLFINLQCKFIRTDGFAYYSYLPAAFIEHDMSFKNIIEKEAAGRGESLPVYQECPLEWPLCSEFASFKPLQNGSWYDKYPMGVAVLMSPFFFAADIFVQVSGGIRDGYSLPYQFAIAIAAIVYFQIGLYFSFKVLNKRFSKNMSLLLLVFLITGTNILHYVSYEASMSHVYSFALIALAMFLLDKYLQKPALRLLLLMGLILAMTALIRNLNGLFALIPLFVIIKNTPIKSRVSALIKISALWGTILFLVFIPQMLYWKYALGKFIAFSYGNESFLYILNPQIFNVLFDLRSNGLFFWHPLLLLVIPGSYYWVKSADKIGRASIVFLLVMLYFISSWWGYQFGSAFGHRAFTDYYLLFLIPVGYLFYRLKRDRRKPAIIFCIVVIVVFCILNLIHLRNYWGGIVASHNLTPENYWRNFADPHLEVLWQKLDKLRKLL